MPCKILIYFHIYFFKEINCDFSCRFKENVSECSADKKILIKSKNMTGGVARDEVFSDVCAKLNN